MIPYFMAGFDEHSTDFQLNRWPGTSRLRHYSHGLVRLESPFMMPANLRTPQRDSRLIEPVGIHEMSVERD